MPSSRQPPTTDRCPRSALLKQHLPLVRRIAGRMKAAVSANVEMDDLIQVGMLGLDQALNGYDDSHGTTFDTYAARRIHGAMLDELRQQDHLSRTTRGRLRQIRVAVQKLEHDLGRPPRAIETSRALGWTLQAFHDSMVAGGAAGLRFGDGELDVAENEASLAELEASEFFSAEHPDPEAMLQRRQDIIAVNEAFAALAESDRVLLTRLYKDEATITSIAGHLGVTPSRVSQMHASAVAKLRDRIAGRTTRLPDPDRPHRADAAAATDARPAPASAAPDWLEQMARKFVGTP